MRCWTKDFYYCLWTQFSSVNNLENEGLHENHNSLIVLVHKEPSRYCYRVHWNYLIGLFILEVYRTIISHCIKYIRIEGDLKPEMVRHQFQFCINWPIKVFFITYCYHWRPKSAIRFDRTHKFKQQGEMKKLLKSFFKCKFC